MTVTVGDIIAKAQLRSEEIYDAPTWMMFLNSVLDDLTPYAKILKTHEIYTESQLAMGTDGSKEVNVTSQPLSGTLTTAVGSAAVTGTSTKFTTELKVGDRITVGSETKTVIAITSDTSLTVHSNYIAANSGVTATLSLPIHELLNVYANQKFDDTFVGYEQLRTLPPSDTYSKGYKYNSAYLSLQGLAASGNYKLKLDYYAKLQYVSSTTDEIETVTYLPEQFSNLLVDGMCALSQQKEEELNDKESFSADYRNSRYSMFLERTWVTEPHNRKALRKLRLMGGMGGQNGGAL